MNAQHLIRLKVIRECTTHELGSQSPYMDYQNLWLCIWCHTIREYLHMGILMTPAYQGRGEVSVREGWNFVEDDYIYWWFSSLKRRDMQGVFNVSEGFQEWPSCIHKRFKLLQLLCLIDAQILVLEESCYHCKLKHLSWSKYESMYGCFSLHKLIMYIMISLS